MQPPVPQTRDIVLIGGGHTHALVLRMWGMDPLPGARLTVINPGPTAPYTGMLPGYVAGHYSRDELDIDLVRLARFAGARLILDRASGLDLTGGMVALAGRPPVAFDVASFDIGIHAHMPAIPGYAENAVSVKPLDRFATAWAGFLETLGHGKAAQAVVIGGGVGGVELALAMAHGARARGARLGVTVIDRGRILDRLSPRAAGRLSRAMAAHGVATIDGVEAERITSGAVVLSDGRELASDFTLGAAGARPYDWVRGTGLDLHDGFINVGPRLQSPTDPRIFATGDCAHLSHAPRAKAGVYAVRAAPILNANLRAALDAGRWRDFRPQRDFLKLISMGGKSAVADKNGVVVSGRWLWRLKDRIDRRFMTRLDDLPDMAPAALPRRAAPGVAEALAGPVPCGGCGAKVGAAALEAALARLAADRPDIETGPGDDAAILRLGDTRMAITTDQLRAFTEDPYVMTRITAIHALGDIHAMGARAQAVLPILTLPPLSAKLQSRMLTEILAASSEVFDTAGAAIVGGHTATGAELSVGFTITGLLPGRSITLDGAQPGDALVLTKALGTGTVLAAEMARAARGGDVVAALSQMQRDSGAAAVRLSGAHAMTDVTGFGLAGHLVKMLDASGVGADLSLDAVPFLPGAIALAEAGRRSTLFAANAAFVDGRLLGPDGARKDLLCDPQTAGGLLAAVAEGQADSLVAGLRRDGYDAARIGTIVAGPPRITAR